jgi:hypothetical protein
MAPKSRKSAAPPAPPAKQKTDWDAVERDYRTGRFTLRELTAKHGPTHTTIARRAEREGWTKDLTEAIRQATNAKLVQQSVQQVVQQECTNAHQAVTESVLVAAEMNKDIILGHRSDLKAARTVAVSLLDELSKAAMLAADEDALIDILAGKHAEPQDLARARSLVQKALSVNSRISSVKALAEAFTKLHDGERRAFNIGDEPPKTPGGELAEFLNDLSARGSRLPIAGAGSAA